jgi:adenylylsulfate kinase
MSAQVDDKNVTDSNGTGKATETYGRVQTVGKATNIAWHNSSITRSDIEKKNQHKSAILWFTGLSGSGKSTLANAVHQELFNRKLNSYVLDGDNVRHGLCRDLGFTDEDRVENIRRIGEMASLFLDAGVLVLTAFVSPFRSDRDRARSLVKNVEDFVEIYCEADLKVCEDRDTKGLYAKARAGIIPNFTGISSKYETPEQPELRIATGSESLGDCVKEVIEYLERKKII